MCEHCGKILFAGEHECFDCCRRLVADWDRPTLPDWEEHPKLPERPAPDDGFDTTIGTAAAVPKKGTHGRE